MVPTVGVLADAEVLMALPAVPFPATIEEFHRVDDRASVAFRGNRSSVNPGLVCPGQVLSGPSAPWSRAACRPDRRGPSPTAFLLSVVLLIALVVVYLIQVLLRSRRPAKP